MIFALMVFFLPHTDAPFITSLVKKKAPLPPQQTSSALESFMKFDRKYGVKGSTLAAAAAKTDSEPDPEEVSEEAVTPSKIASELEEKVCWDPLIIIFSLAVY